MRSQTLLQLLQYQAFVDTHLREGKKPLAKVFDGSSHVIDIVIDNQKPIVEPSSASMQLHLSVGMLSIE